MKKIEFTEALKLRQKGFSLTEISKQLSISKSTVSDWVKDIELSTDALDRLKTKVTAGQFKSAENKRNITEKSRQESYKNTLQQLEQVNFNQIIIKLCCSLINWCEGGKKDEHRIQFTNSDPKLIKAFLSLLRNCYQIDESRLRVCVHLHDYHVAKDQIAFWSEITKIPENQFIKPFIKKNTGKRIHKNYPGCVQIRYYDTKVCRDLIMTGKASVDYINRGFV